MSEEHRYLFTVRQRFGEVPVVDTFYEITVPSGISGEQAKVMNTLSDGNFYKDEIKEDSSVMRGMTMRLRFNSDMYPHICLIRSDNYELTAEMLDDVVANKHETGTLMKFLKESEING